MEAATPDRPDRMLIPQSAEDEAFWLPEEKHRRILDDPLVETKVKMVDIASAAAREGAFVRYLFQLPDDEALHHALQLARYAIERRGWLTALDQSLLAAKKAAPSIDERVFTREALDGFLVRRHWEGGLAETRKMVQSRSSSTSRFPNDSRRGGVGVGLVRLTGSFTAPGVEQLSAAVDSPELHPKTETPSLWLPDSS